MKKQHEILQIETIETALLLYSKGICTICHDGKYCTVEKEYQQC